MEEIKNQSGERGWHILSPLPQDPGRVVRVWESTGVLETVVATPAQSEPVTKLSVADAGAYLAQRNREGAFGYSWDEIERRQGGRLTRNA